MRENEAALMTDNTETEVSNQQKDIESTDNGTQTKRDIQNANEKKVLNKKLDDLAVSFFEKTNTVVEDASYEDVDVVDAKIENEDLFFKIKW
ncbi:unnamed protein product [Brachionus calyciflorus]|uniref:Uncharacterized protein n=1 Tax=Brachionus calyciflorus TaxID=104777 RepID=A0A814LJ81_9BILA|nr:unnamed protein product [Brachionus calyciflorus]